MSRRLLMLRAALLLLLAVAYANHFDNGFHFDDLHAIVQNPFVRSMGSIPRFFKDATTFSLLPSNQSYRPVLQTTLAIDYRLGGGYKARIYQISTFVFFLIQLWLMYLLFAAIAEAVRPGNHNLPASLLATALYALHPVCAETINYVIQRGEILATLGVLGAMVLYVRVPWCRRTGLYLLPFALAVLSKQTAIVFPALLFAYLVLFDKEGLERSREALAWPGIAAALRAVVPALVAAVLLGAWIQMHMPRTYVLGGASNAMYWITQPFVALRYFAEFFVPLGLSVDNDWPLLGSADDPRALAGYVFIAAMIAGVIMASRRAEWRPVAFGLWWFLIALVPTAALPLAEVANDHRMWFPFVGLTFAVAWGASLLWERLPLGRWRTVAAIVVIGCVLVAEALGVRSRNEVWRSDESLWFDATVKSPNNARGLMNYGVIRMEKGDYPTAIAYFERAMRLRPFYPLLHLNLGLAYGGTARPQDAEREFSEAIRLAPDDWRPHLFYGRWLMESGHLKDAAGHLALAHAQNPADLEADELLKRAEAQMRGQAAGPATAEDYLEQSLRMYQAGRYRDCIAAAREALKSRPSYAEAFNNIAAAHNSLGEWEDGIAAAEMAVRLKPGFQLARNNLAWARARKGVQR